MSPLNICNNNDKSDKTNDNNSRCRNSNEDFVTCQSVKNDDRSDAVRDSTATETNARSIINQYVLLPTAKLSMSISATTVVIATTTYLAPSSSGPLQNNGQ